MLSLLEAYNKILREPRFNLPLHIKEYKTNSLIISRTRTRTMLIKRCSTKAAVTEYTIVHLLRVVYRQGTSRSQVLIIDRRGTVNSIFVFESVNECSMKIHVGRNASILFSRTKRSDKRFDATFGISITIRAIEERE